MSARSFLRRIAPPRRPKPVNPVLLHEAEQRAARLQTRVADAITRFAGSMAFVYVHIAWFAVWIGAGLERYPFGLLTSE